MQDGKTDRIDFLETTTKATAGAVVMPHFNINSSKPKMCEMVIGHSDFEYKVHKEWGNLDPAKTPVNNCHEMIMDSKGRLVMVGDDTHNNVLIYD